VAGLARFGAGADRSVTADAGTEGGRSDDRRYDAPIEVVGPLPFPVRVGVALIRTWSRHRHHRVQ
jgi:hypothetical protein